MITDAEMVFWLAAGAVALIGSIALWVVGRRDGDLYVPEETIRRIENGGHHLQDARQICA